MRTELPRPFSTGFVLEKTALEDIHNLLIRQMEGTVIPLHPYTAAYEVRFRYGAIQERATLQDILSEPNGGESTIEGLKISMEDKNNPKDRTITLQFSNVRNLPNPSIYYNIVGTDAAWVNDTDTKLATRIQGVKTFSLDSFVKQFLPEGRIGTLLLIILVFNVVPFFLPFMFSNMLTVFIGTSLLLILALLVPVGMFFFPSYNFCWGTYATSFRRRRAIGIWIFSAIFVATIVGVLVNFLSTKIIH